MHEKRWNGQIRTLETTEKHFAFARVTQLALLECRAAVRESSRMREMCLIRRIPLKSAAECWVVFVCDNRRKRHDVWRLIRDCDRQQEGQQEARQLKGLDYQRAPIRSVRDQFQSGKTHWIFEPGGGGTN